MHVISLNLYMKYAQSINILSVHMNAFKLNMNFGHLISSILKIDSKLFFSS